MATTIRIFLMTSIFLLVFTGCSNHKNPVEPSAQIPSVQSGARIDTPFHNLLNFSILTIDKTTLEIDVQPVRTTSIHVNVTSVLNGTNGVIAEIVTPDSKPGEGYIVVDLTIFHPYPDNTNLNGFDVKGILIIPGTLTAGNVVVAGTDETRLLNADGYTRWWNPTEFPQPGFFGYTKGNLTTTPQSLLTATVNPYISYADTLYFDFSGPNQIVNKPVESLWGRGVYSGYASLPTQRYEIQFPMVPWPVIKFGYAVDASWEKAYVEDPGQGPENFPIAANQPEAYYVNLQVTDHTLWYNSINGDHGGQLRATVDVHDWQGQINGDIANEVGNVSIIAPGLMDGAVEGLFKFEDNFRAVYEFDLSGLAVPTKTGEFLLVCSVESSDGAKYKQTFAPAPDETVCAYDVEVISIANKQDSTDDNNSVETSETVMLDETAFGTASQSTDPVDWYNFYMMPIPVLSGGVNLWCDYDTVDLVLVDSNDMHIAKEDVADGVASLDFVSLDLPPGRYYLQIAAMGETEVVPYSLEMSPVFDPGSANLVEVTPAGLDLGEPGKVAAWGDVLYIGQSYGDMVIHSVDISNPESPVILDTVDIGDPTWELAAGENFVASNNWGAETTVIDSSDPSDLKVVTGFESQLSVLGIAAWGNYLYVSGNDGFQVWDLSIPSVPSLVSTLATDPLYYMKCSDEYVTGVNPTYGAVIISVKDPMNPEKVGDYYPWAMQRVDIYGDYLYVRWWTHLIIVDISTPSEPFERGSLGNTEYSFQDKIDVDGRYAYFGGTGSLPIFEGPMISTLWPSQFPEYVEKFDGWGGDDVIDVLAHNGFLYLVTYNGLKIYSVD